MVEVVGGRLQPLVGPRGAPQEALQELTPQAIIRATRRKELTAVARNAVEKVKEHGDAVRLEPMSAFERKCVHDVVNAISGVESESEGVEPNRRIIVRPAD
jgi:spoIIIJ-associated protein